MNTQLAFKHLWADEASVSLICEAVNVNMTDDEIHGDVLEHIAKMCVMAGGAQRGDCT